MIDFGLLGNPQITLIALSWRLEEKHPEVTGSLFQSHFKRQKK